MKNLVVIAAFLVVSSASISCSAQQSTHSNGRTLTAADMVGPDGITYPIVAYAGVPGGIPHVEVAAKIEEYGGKVESDISDAIEKGAKAIGARGGGALLLPAGTFYLNRPIAIAANNFVLRGAGRDATKIVFRWQPPEYSVQFIGLKNGDVISPNRPIWAAAWNPSRDNKVEKAIKRIAFEINGQQAAEQSSGEGPWFALTADNRKTATLFKNGENTLRALVEYFDGRTHEQVITVQADTARPELASGPTDSAIQFMDATAGAPAWARGDLATLPKRGDKFLQFAQTQEFKPGDVLRLTWPGGGWLGHPLVEIEAVEGTRVLLKQPLRHDMDKINNVRRVNVLRGSGVENLTLAQSSQHWTNLLSFSNDFGCWVRNVRLENAGRHPINGGTKHFEVRDTIANGTQFHFGVGGGTGYFGFSGGQDCLMDNVQTFKLRHAPNFQFGTQGSVIRNSTFEDSDAQFHRDPTWDNLLENCVIRSRGSNQSYGSYGAALTITTNPKSAPLGARNVIWNNDFESRTIYKGGTAISLAGGAMQNWIFAYNRFDHDIGFAVNSDGPGHNVLFLKNNFAVKAPDASAIKGDTGQLRLIENSFAGWSERTLLPTGADVAENKANCFTAEYSVPARPTAPVPSLFEWQRVQLKKP